jgi:hypothetical protein
MGTPVPLTPDPRATHRMEAKLDQDWVSSGLVISLSVTSRQQITADIWATEVREVVEAIEHLMAAIEGVCR